MIEFEQDQDNGDWIAKVGNWQGIGWNKDLAVRRLFQFLSDYQSDVFHQYKHLLEDHFRSYKVGIDISNGVETHVEAVVKDGVIHVVDSYEIIDGNR